MVRNADPRGRRGRRPAQGVGLTASAAAPTAAVPAVAAEPLEARTLFAATFYVSPAGSDSAAGTDSAHAWRTVQKAMTAATPGSTVRVAAGVYHEKLLLKVSGTPGNYITFKADPGAVIDGRSATRPAGYSGNDLLRISGRSYVKVVGFEFANDLNVSDASGIRLLGADHHIELRSNRIHRITGDSAMGITVYGTDAAAGIHDLVVDGNEVYDCQPLESEAVTLNGNVSAFRVTNNRVHDNNNIGIDVIGHEGLCPDPAKDQAHNGTVAGNRVWNCRQGGTDSAFAAGIYVDGGRDVLVERNRVWGCNVGVEVGCEHKGKTASNVTVRDNVLYLNDKAGLAFGGYDSGVGRVVNCRFTNNTLYRNAEATNRDQRYGQIWVQWARDCVVKSNVAYAAAGRRLAFFEAGGQSNVVLDYNVYYRPGGTGAAVTFDGDRDYGTVDAYLSAWRQDFHSVFVDPKFADAAGGNFDLLAGSGAINAGDPTYAPASGETDIGGGSRRLGGRVDAGADERA